MTLPVQNKPMDSERSAQSQDETKATMIPQPSPKDSTASITTSDSKNPGGKLIRRVTDSIRRRFSRNDKRNSSLLQSSSSTTSLPTASTVLVDRPASSKDVDHLERHSDRDHYRQSASDTLSTSSTIVAEPEPPKPSSVVSVVKTGDNALDDSLAFSVIQTKEAIEADIPDDFPSEIPLDLEEAAKMPLPQSPLPVAHIIIEPPTPQMTEATLEETINLPQEHDHELASFSNGENPIVPESSPGASAPEHKGPHTTPLGSTEPLSPLPQKGREGPPRPNFTATGLATLFMLIPIPQIRFGIRALPLSLIFLWYLLQC